MSDMTVIRAASRSQGWATMDKAILRPEAGLDCWLVGALFHLLALPPGWKLHIKDLQKRFGCGRDKARDTMSRLMAAGYVLRIKNRVAGQFATHHFMVFESPADAKAWLAKQSEAVGAEVSANRSTTAGTSGAGPCASTRAGFPGAGNTGAAEDGHIVSTHGYQRLTDTNPNTLPPSPTRDARADAAGGRSAHALQDARKAAISAGYATALQATDDEVTRNGKEAFHGLLRREVHAMGLPPDKVYPYYLGVCTCGSCEQDRAPSAPPATPQPTTKAPPVVTFTAA